MASYYRDSNTGFQLDHEHEQLFSANAPNGGNQHVEGHDGEQARGNGPTRYCSVRGCTSVLPPDYSNKMCEICRGRHRIYASTKRAKRKIEKAALGMQNGWIPGDEDSHDSTQPMSGQEVRSCIEYTFLL
jgi:hypothetical protein